MKTAFSFAKDRFLGKTIDRLPQHDLVFGVPLNDPMGGLPIGDGETGTLLWTEKDTLRMQVNKCDLWDETAGTDGVFCAEEDERLTCLRHAGQIAVRFGTPCFDELFLDAFEQRLRLSEAVGTVESRSPFGTVQLSSFASADARTTVTDCRLAMTEPDAPEITLSRFGSRTMWRWYERIRHCPQAGLDGTQAYDDGSCLFIVQRVSSGVFCFGMLIDTDEAYRTEVCGTHTVRLTLDRRREHRFTMYHAVVSALGPTQAVDLCRTRLMQAAAQGVQMLKNEHIARWTAFWNRSGVSIPDDYIENIYYLTLYYAESECRGAYPPHFTSGLWSFYHDFLPWNYYFHYNMQHLYATLDAAGHSELSDGYFAMRRRALPAAERYAREVKGCGGAFYHDVSDFRGRGSHGDSLNCTPGAQIAMAMWQRFRYTGDEMFLRDTALPVMRGAAAFYLAQLVPGSDGIYHLHGTSAYEGNEPSDDTETDLTEIRRLFSVLVGLTEGEERERYADVLRRLPEQPYAPLEADEWDGEWLLCGIGTGQPASGGGVVPAYGRDGHGHPLRRMFGDAEKTAEIYGFPDVELSPIYPAGMLGLADCGTQRFAAARDLLLLQAPVPLMHWCMTPIYLARMGMAEHLPDYLRQMLARWQLYPNGMNGDGPQGGPQVRHRLDFRTPYDTDTKAVGGVESYAYRYFDLETAPIVTKAVQEALLQSYDGVLRICPAIRPEDPVAFLLYAEGGFVVQAEVTGESYLIVIDSMRGEPCRICLPPYADRAALHVYCCQDDDYIPVEPVFGGKDGTLLLLDGQLCADGRVVLCSAPRDAWETQAPAPVEPNRDMKRCAEACLGSPQLPSAVH